MCLYLQIYLNNSKHIRDQKTYFIMQKSSKYYIYPSKNFHPAIEEINIKTHSNTLLCQTKQWHVCKYLHTLIFIRKPTKQTSPTLQSHPNSHAPTSHNHNQSHSFNHIQSQTSTKYSHRIPAPRNHVQSFSCVYYKGSSKYKICTS
jgi:hypothetical protein